MPGHIMCFLTGLCYCVTTDILILSETEAWGGGNCKREREYSLSMTGVHKFKDLNFGVFLSGFITSICFILYL